MNLWYCLVDHSNEYLFLSATKPTVKEVLKAVYSNTEYDQIRSTKVVIKSLSEGLLSDKIIIMREVDFIREQTL